GDSGGTASTRPFTPTGRGWTGSLNFFSPRRTVFSSQSKKTAISFQDSSRASVLPSSFPAINTNVRFCPVLSLVRGELPAEYKRSQARFQRGQRRNPPERRSLATKRKLNRRKQYLKRLFQLYLR